MKYDQLNQIQQFSDAFLSQQSEINIQIFDVNKLFYYTISKQFVPQILDLCKPLQNRILSSIQLNETEGIITFFENTLIYQYIQNAKEEYQQNKINSISNDDCEQLNLYKLWLRIDYLQHMRDTFKEKVKLEGSDKEFNIGNQIVIPSNYFTSFESNFEQFVQKMDKILDIQQKQIVKLIDDKINETKGTFRYWYVLSDYKNILQHQNVAQQLNLRLTTQQTLDIYFNQINEQCQSMQINENNLNHMQVKENLTFFNRTYFNLDTIMNSVKAHNTADTIQFEQRIQQQKEELQIAERKYGNLLVATLQKMFMNTKIQFLLFFNDQKRLQCGLTQREFNISKSVLHIYELQYDKKFIVSQQLLNFALSINQLNTTQQRFEFYCQYYESLFTRIKSYLKPILINIVTQLERELNKGTQATRIDFHVTNVLSQVEKIKKVQTQIENLIQQFDNRISSIENVDKILVKQIQIINDMKVYDTYKIQECSNKIKEQMIKLKNSPNYRVIEIYFTGAFCYAIANKQKILLKLGFQGFKPIQTIELQSDLKFNPSVEQVNNYFNKQLDMIRNIPQELRLTDSKDLQNVYNEMSKLTIEESVILNQKIRNLCDQLKQMEDQIYEQCKMITLTNNQLIEGNQQTIEQCISLVKQQIEKSNKQTQNNQNQDILYQFPQLVQSQDNQNVYYLVGSDNCIQISMQSLIKIFAKRDNLLSSIGVKLFSARIEQVNNELTEFLQKTEEKLKQMPQQINIEQLKEVISFVNQSQQQFQEYKTKYMKSLQKASDFIPTVEISEIQKYKTVIETIIDKFNQLEKLIQKADKDVEKRKEQLFSKMQNDIQGDGLLSTIQSLIEQIKIQITQQTQLFTDQMMSLSTGNQFSQIQNKLKEIEAIDQLLQKQQDELGKQVQQIDQTVEDLKQTFPQNYASIMNVDTQNKISQIKKDSQSTIEQSKQFISQIKLIQQLNKLSQLKFYDAAVQIDQFQLKKEDKVNSPIYLAIDKLFNQSIYIIQQLKSSWLQDQHYTQIGQLFQVQGSSQNILENLNISQIFEIIGKKMYTQQAFLTSEQLSPQYKKFINELKNIILSAENEYKINQEVEKTTLFVQQQCIVQFQNQQLNTFSISKLQSDLGQLQNYTPVNGNFKPLLQKLQEHITLILSIKDNKYSRAYKPQIQQLQQELEQMVHDIHKIIDISQQIKVLEPVVSQRVLIDVINLFYETMNQMHILYKDSMNQQKEDKSIYEMNVYKLIKSSQDIDNQLDSIENNLQEINIKLKAFLEQKRLSFSKLFFLSDTDVLELFSNYQTINKHIKKLFSGVEQVIWNGDIITGLISQEGETLKLQHSITVTKQTPVDQWLKQLDKEIKYSLKQELYNYLGINESGTGQHQQFYGLTDFKCNFEKIPINMTSDVVILIYAIYFASLIDRSFIMQGDARKSSLTQVIQQLEIIMNECTKLLTELSTAQVGTQEYLNYLKTKNLATDLSQYIQQAKQLQNATAMTWQYNQLMLLKISKETGLAEYHCQNISLLYNFEYQGLISKLIFTPLTEKQFQTLVSSISLQKSTNSIGMAGTGKTESVKSFANRLGRNCVVFNCDSSVQREDLQRIMKGVILSGAIGCFDEVNRLSETVLSGISKDVELILLDQWIQDKVEKSQCPSHIFLTMNPPNRNYRGRNALPFSLTKLLRICYMDKPDTTIIIEKILETNGFKYSKNIAEKVFLVFQLSKTLVPKEVYLDWGLRSIQNVLREASLMKSDIQRTQKKTELTEEEEIKIIIKSLQNQTLSKLTVSSQKIYQEILDDLFGQEIQKDCNIKTELEVNLYNSIETDNEHYKELAIQLFKSLTNKLGVCLLGFPASGKTKIRKELFKAVNKLSNGKILVKEYLISPKAVSRQDLLGYVDPTTKQWIDGSLTKAARQAVKDLDQKDPYLWPVIVFDGQIDPAWIEALNSCLDDNRLLSLSSGERIRFPIASNPFDSIKSENGKMPVNFLFETDSLQHASPATVSRLAVILVAGLTKEQMKQELKQDGLDQVIDQLQNNDKTLLITSQAQILGKELGLQKVGQIADYIIDDKDPQKQLILQSFGINQSFTNQDAYDLLIDYFNLGKSVIVEGQHESGKSYMIKQISQELNNVILVEYQINKLSIREDIFYILRKYTQEVVDVSGEKILKPQNNKKLILLLQSVDMSSLDEYNHSEIQNVIFSIVKHGQLYMQTGQCYKLENIMLALTSTGEMELEQRIIRSVGYVKLQQLDSSSLQSILKQTYQTYNFLIKNEKLIKYKQNAIKQMENIYQQFKDQQNINNVIITPNIYKISNLKLNFIQKINKLVKNSEQLQNILQLLYISACSDQQQRDQFNNSVQQSNQLITWQKIGTTSENLIKQLQINEMGKQVPENHEQNYEFVNTDVRLNMLNEIFDQCKQFFDYQLLQTYINGCDVQTRNTLLQYLSVTELSSNINRGTFIISQPDNFNVEITQLAFLINYYKIYIVPCEQFSFTLIKNIIQQIISGTQKIALIIDNNVIQQDYQYIKFISIILTNNKPMFEQLCPVSELKQFQEQFADALPNKQNLTQAQISNMLLDKILDSLHIIIFGNPENRFTDTITSYSNSIEKYCTTIYWPHKSIIDGKNQMFSQILKIENLSKLEPIFTKLCQRYQSMLISDKIEVGQSYFNKQFVLTNQFIKQYDQQLNIQEKKYSAGLKQLQAAQSQVDILSKDAIQRQQAVKQSEEIANKALIIIQDKMKTVEENKVKAAQIEQELKAKEGNVFREKEQAEAELETVKPIIEQAKQSVANIPADAIREVKGFNNPPMGVQIVLQAVCMIMGVKDLSWKSLRQFISQQGILKTICSFEPNKCPISAINKVQQLMEEHPEAFQQEKIIRVSQAAAPLALWVEANIKFLVIYAKVEPLIKKCEEANKNLKSLREELSNIQIQVTRLTKEADELRKDYQIKSDEVVKLKSELQQIEQKKNVGVKMLDQLKGERQRWTQKSKQITEQLQQLIQTSGITAGMYVFAGCETDDFRQNFLSQQRIKVDNLILQPEFISQVDQTNIIQSSNQNYENIVLLDQFMKQNQFKVLVITHTNEQNRILDYIQKVYEQQIQVISSLQENVSNLIQISSKYGKTVVLTQCDNGYVPPAAVPYLQHNISSHSIDIETQNTQMMDELSNKLLPQNSQQNEISQDFKLILVSSIQMKIPSDLQRKTLSLSFAPTNKSRIKFYIDTILESWSQQTVEKLQTLKASELKLQCQQEDIEKDLLNALENSTQTANILEDKDLIQVLDKSQKQSQVIQQSLQMQEQTKQQLNIMTDKVSKLAVVVQKSVNVFTQLNTLNDLYVFEDSSALSILRKVLNMYKDECKDGQISDELVNKGIKSYLNLIYTRLTQMVQSSDRIPALILLLKEFYPTLLTQKVYKFFSNNINNKEIENIEVPQWVNEQQNRRLKMFIYAMDSSSDVDRMNLSNFSAYSSWISKIQMEKSLTRLEVPSTADFLNIIQKAMLIITFRPEFISSVINIICDNKFGEQQTTSAVDLALEISTPIKQPIIIFAGSGQDITLKSQIVNIIPGKEELADKEIQKLLQSNQTTYIVVKGANLCRQWLQKLSSNLGQFKSNNPKSQIIIIMEPIINFPVSLLSISQIIFLQQTINPKKQMIEILNTMFQMFRDKTNNYQKQSKHIPQYIIARLFYSLASTHCIIEARQQYSPRGMSYNPGFTQQNILLVAENIVNTYLQDETLNTLINTLPGNVSKIFYNVQLKDKSDEIFIDNLIGLIFNKEILQKICKGVQGQFNAQMDINQNMLTYSFNNMLIQACQLFMGLKYTLPPITSLQCNNAEIIQRLEIEYITRNYPEVVTPELLCLMANAMQSKAQQELLNIENSLVRLQGAMYQQDQNQEQNSSQMDLYQHSQELLKMMREQVQNQVKQIDQQVNNDIQQIDEVNIVYPLIKELQLQLQTIVKLTKIILEDLEQLYSASQNYLLQTVFTKQILFLINSGIAPERWTIKFDFVNCSTAPHDSPQLVSLQSGTIEDYFTLLLNSSKSISKSITNAIECAQKKSESNLIPIDLNLLPRPLSFLEAARRYIGKAEKILLDQVELQMNRSDQPLSASYPIITITKQSIILEGCQIQRNVANYEAKNSELDYVFLQRKLNVDNINKTPVIFYVDEQRTTRISVCENIYFDLSGQNDKQMSIYGVYCHLKGR